MIKTIRLILTLLWIASITIILYGCSNSPYSNIEEFNITDASTLDLCIGESVSRTKNQDVINLECEMKPIREAYIIEEIDPGVLFARIICQCGDNSSGGLSCTTCTCQANETSNCDSFVAWCDEQGHEALGGGDIGICNM